MVQKSTFRKIGIAILALVVALVAVQLGFNYYLYKRIPQLVSTNTDYQVSYKNLDVGVLTGRIKASDVEIRTKSPDNPNVLRVEGTIDSMNVSQIGLIDAVLRNDLNAANITLHRATLLLRLNKPLEKQQGKKRKPARFSKIALVDSNIKVLRDDASDMVAIEELNLELYNLQLSEKDVEDKLPIAFDRYSISGKKFSFLTDSKYRITIDEITSKAKNMVLKNFHLKSEIPFLKYKARYPTSQNYFSLSIPHFEFQELLLKDRRIALENVLLENPSLKVHSTGAQRSKNTSPFLFDINLKNLDVKNAKVDFFTPKGVKIANAGSLDVNISELELNQESQKGNLPIDYKDFRIEGSQVQYATSTQSLSAAAMQFTPAQLLLRSPTYKSTSGSRADLQAQEVLLTFKSFLGNKEDFDLEGTNLGVKGLRGKIQLNKSNAQSKAYKPIAARLSQVQINAPALTVVNSQGKTFDFKNIHIRGNGFDLRQPSQRGVLPFKCEQSQLSFSSLRTVLDRNYTLSLGSTRMDGNLLASQKIQLLPRRSRAAFVASLPKEKDLYSLSLDRLQVNGIRDLWENRKVWNIEKVTLTGLRASIFRSKVPPDDTQHKPMYSALLRSIKQPLTIGSLSIGNSHLTYEEDTKKSEGPGKLVFGAFNLEASNVHTAHRKSGTKIPIEINARFMDVSPIDIKWNLDTGSPTDQFSISGNIWSLPAASLNAFVEPYLKIQTTGQINHIRFNYAGNQNQLSGSFAMKHKDLKVSILNQEGDKNKLLSAAANLLVKSNSGSFPATVTVENVERDPTKSFFNFFWLGMQEGLKKTLIGANADKTQQRVENTLNKTKEISENIKEIRTGTSPADSAQSPSKKGSFKLRRKQ